MLFVNVVINHNCFIQGNLFINMSSHSSFFIILVLSCLFVFLLQKCLFSLSCSSFISPPSFLVLVLHVRVLLLHGLVRLGLLVVVVDDVVVVVVVVVVLLLVLLLLSP